MQGKDNIKRVLPGEFKELPKSIVKNLERRGCAIPQAFGIRKKHNVISGKFFGRDKKDWAVLCSRKGVSSILIFQNGSTKSITKIAEANDADFLQEIDEKGTQGFSRAIGAVNAKYIYDRQKSYGRKKLPKILHQGINDAFVEKASEIHYFHQGKWLRFQGAD